MKMETLLEQKKIKMIETTTKLRKVKLFYMSLYRSRFLANFSTIRTILKNQFMCDMDPNAS